MTEINKTIFRGYDIRGRVNHKELNEKTLEIIGKGFGTYLARRKIHDFIIGHDFRSYSEKLKNALIKGLVSTGAHIIDLGLILCFT